MTFEEALTRITSDHMPELGLDTHTEARLLRLLGDAHAETATAFGLLNFTYRISVKTGNVTLAIPDANGGYAARTISKIERASFGGRQLWPAPRENVSVDESHLNFIPGYPRYFYWRPEQWNSISILPKAPKDGTLVLHTLQTFSRNVQKADLVWGGMFESFNDIVVLTAAKRAFEASFEEQNAAMIGEQLSKRRQEFAVHQSRQELVDFAPAPGQGQGG